MNLDDKTTESSNDLFRQFFQSAYLIASKKNIQSNKFYDENNYNDILKNVCDIVPQVKFDKSEILQCTTR